MNHEKTTRNHKKHQIQELPQIMEELPRAITTKSKIHQELPRANKNPHLTTNTHHHQQISTKKHQEPKKITRTTKNHQKPSGTNKNKQEPQISTKNNQ